MNDLRAVLIRGSDKVIGHYRMLLTCAKTEKEREFYLAHIEREQRLLGQLQHGMTKRRAA